MSQDWLPDELEILQQLAPFSQLPSALREETLNQWKRCEAEPGEILLEKGQTKHTHLYVVLSGDVRLIGGVVNRSSASAPPGTIFGIPNLLQGGPSPYEALVALPTAYAKLRAFHFEKLRENDSDFAAVFQQEFEPLPEQADAGGWSGGVEGSPFAFLQNWHGHRPWGSVLDAGTGESSLRWIMGLPTERWVAITGDPTWMTALQTMFGSQFREQDKLILHNWTDEALLSEEKFDVVIADYLLGAIERFAPYFQIKLWSRLKPHVGNWLHIVGLEPTQMTDAKTVGGSMVQSINQLRDSCLVMVGKQGFREYPLSWVKHTLKEAGFAIEAVQTFDNRFGPRYIDTLLDDCLRMLPDFPSNDLAVTTAHYIASLRQQAMSLPETHWGIRFSQDYAVIARPA